MTTKPVIVGVDGSEESLRAVEWAALEARRHSSPLRIVSAPGRSCRGYTPTRRPRPRSPTRCAGSPRGRWTRPSPGARRWRRACRSTPACCPGRPRWPSRKRLGRVHAGRGGPRGGRVRGDDARLGEQVRRRRAPCPVVVVREESTAVHREIAVGVRDPEEAPATLAFAFEEAALRGADLVAVHTWYWHPRRRRPARPVRCGRRTPARISAEADRQLAAALERMAGQVPGRERAPGRHPRAPRAGAGQLLGPRRPGGTRQARPSRGHGSRHRLDPARGPRPRPRPGRGRPSAQCTAPVRAGSATLSFVKEICRMKMKTIGESRSRTGACWCAPTSTCRWTAAGSRTTAGSGPACRP